MSANQASRTATGLRFFRNVAILPMLAIPAFVGLCVLLAKFGIV